MVTINYYSHEPEYNGIFYLSLYHDCNYSKSGNYLLQKWKHLCRGINSESRRFVSKNQSGFAFGLLSFKHWVLCDDFNFLAKDALFISVNRNDRYQNSHHNFHHFDITLSQYYYSNQIHSEINQITF